MAAALAKPEPVPAGAIKTFGERGPAYEVLGLASQGPKGNMVRVRVLLTGEELDYPVADMFDDPYKP